MKSWLGCLPILLLLRPSVWWEVYRWQHYFKPLGIPWWAH
jgi:hypothetical protein